MKRKMQCLLRNLSLDHYKCPCSQSAHHFCGKRVGRESAREHPQHGDPILCKECEQQLEPVFLTRPRADVLSVSGDDDDPDCQSDNFCLMHDADKLGYNSAISGFVRHEDKCSGP